MTVDPYKTDFLQLLKNPSTAAIAARFVYDPYSYVSQNPVNSVDPTGLANLCVPNSNCGLTCVFDPPIPVLQGELKLPGKQPVKYTICLFQLAFGCVDCTVQWYGELGLCQEGILHNRIYKLYDTEEKCKCP